MTDQQVNLTDEELAAGADELRKDPSLLNRLDSDTRRRWTKIAGEPAPRKQYTGSIESPEDWKAAANFLAGGVAGTEAMRLIGQGATAAYRGAKSFLQSPLGQKVTPVAGDLLADFVPGGHTLARVGKAIMPAAAEATVPATEAAAAVPAAAAAAASPVGGSSLSKIWGAMERLGVRLTAAELPKAQALVSQGTRAEAAVQQIVQARGTGAALDAAAALANRLGTPTDAEAFADLARRAAGGQKTLMPAYGPEGGHWPK
jgi:hypothetical protein